MKQKEFDKLLTSTTTEAITKNSYISLMLDEVDNPVGQWGWSENLGNIRDYFLYVFVLGNMAMYNQTKNINKVSNDFIMSIYDDAIMDPWDVSEVEEKFFMLWNDLTECTNYRRFKKESKELCEYLTSLGYTLKFELYKNPKEAVKEKGKIGTYIPLENDEFLEFLKENIENN